MTHDVFPRFPKRFATRADFGKFGMQLGSGESDALARVSQIAREFLLSIDLTLDMALEWVEFYEGIYERNPRNFSARGRILLMRRAIELLEDTQ